jgi:hypothetical protein
MEETSREVERDSGTGSTLPPLWLLLLLPLQGPGRVAVSESSGLLVNVKVSEECGRILFQVEREVWSTGQLVVLPRDLWSTGHLSVDMVNGQPVGDAAAGFKVVPLQRLHTYYCSSTHGLVI